MQVHSFKFLRFMCLFIFKWGKNHDFDKKYIIWVTSFAYGFPAARDYDNSRWTPEESMRCIVFWVRCGANIEFRVTYSQRNLVLGLGLSLLLRLGLVRLALWLVSGIALNEYRCEYGTLNSPMFVRCRSGVNSFPTRLLSCCTDEYAHMHEIST